MAYKRKTSSEQPQPQRPTDTERQQRRSRSPPSQHQQQQRIKILLPRISDISYGHSFTMMRRKSMTTMLATVFMTVVLSLLFSSHDADAFSCLIQQQPQPLQSQSRIRRGQFFTYQAESKSKFNTKSITDTMKITTTIGVSNSITSSSFSTRVLCKADSNDHTDNAQQKQQQVENIASTTSSPTTTTTSVPPSSKPAPVYITVGPPCSGKSEALRHCLERDGYDPDTVLNQDTDVALDETSKAYCRVPLAAFIYPATQLDRQLGDKVLGTFTPRDNDDHHYNHQQHHSLLSSSSLSSSSSSSLVGVSSFGSSTITTPQPITVTVRDRLLYPGPKPLDSTDAELRNLILRIAGRLTQQEFADRTREQAVQAGDTVKFFRLRRQAIAEDLIKAVETASAQAVGEVLFQREVVVTQQQQGDNDDKDMDDEQAVLGLGLVAEGGDDKDLPYDDDDDDDDGDDGGQQVEEKQKETITSNTMNEQADSTVMEKSDDSSTVAAVAVTPTTTSAHLLSARALIRTPHVDLFIPQALFEGGIHRAEKRLQKLVQRSIEIPVSWGNTNTRPVEYLSALTAAQQAGRPVKFVSWGTRNLPRVSRGELLRRNVERFRSTGRYIPAGAVGAALGRVERLVHEAEQEAAKLFRKIDNENDNDDKGKHNLDEEEEENEQDMGYNFELMDWKDHEINAAFASLAGFVMDEEGYVTKVKEPKNLQGPKKNRNNGKKSDGRSSTRF